MGFQNGWRGPDIVSDGLVLYLDAGSPNSYRTDFGTTWKDMSGFNNSGSLINGPTYSSANGGSIVFDGINDYANFGNINLTSGTDITIEAIVKPGATQQTYADILDYDHSNNLGFVIQQNFTSTNHYYLAYWNGSSYSISSTITLVSNVFNYLSFTKSGTTVTGYLNGTQVIQNTLGLTINATGRVLMISRFVTSSERYFTGNTSVIRIYNKALSATEVLQNYNAQKSRFGL